MLVETRGVEPLTSAMPLQRSAKLSYVPGSASANALKAKFEFIEYRGMRQGTRLFTLENRFSFFEKCCDAFFFVFG